MMHFILIVTLFRGRHLALSACLLAGAVLLCSARPVPGDIYQWEWINPGDPSQGKQQSATLCPGGAGVSAVPAPPYQSFHGRNLTKAYLIDANLENHNFSPFQGEETILTNADLTRANLTDVHFKRVTLAEAVFVDAVISRADFEDTTSRGFTAAQLYSTASYKAKDLRECRFLRNDLSGWNFVGQNLTGANMMATLTGADFTDAVVKGASFNNAPDTGFTSAQLYTTASYRAKDLTGIGLGSFDLAGWNFANQNLTGANFSNATLTGADFTGAVVQRADLQDTTSRGFVAAQLYSTASYDVKNLAGIRLYYNDMTGWNFANQNLTGAGLWGTTLAGAVFTDAVVQGASLAGTTAQGFTSAQLYSTASHKAKDLTGVSLEGNDLTGWDFAKQNLTDAHFYDANLTGADLSQANLTNASFTFADFAGAQLTGAVVKGAFFQQSRNLTAGQLYSTGSYKAKDLMGIGLERLDLTGWSFVGQNLAGGWFASATLINADLAEANLTNANFQYSNLAGANLTRANLTSAFFLGGPLTGADFTDAVVRGAIFYGCTHYGFTAAQFYSTASYKAKDLTGLNLYGNDLTGWSFANQNLSGVSFVTATLTGADFTDAVVRGANFYQDISYPPVLPERQLTAGQLYSTASYKGKDLTGICLANIVLTGWNLAGQNLTDARFDGATLTGADFRYANLTNAYFSRATLTDADLSQANLTNADFGSANLSGATLSSADSRGAKWLTLSDATTTNTILPDGSVQGLDLCAGRRLIVRDYHGDPARSPPLAPIPITVQNSMAMGADGTLQMVLGEESWDSTISFAQGIPVALGGTLELTFAQDVDVSGQLGRTVTLFNWSGVTPTGTFNVSSAYGWDLRHLYTGGAGTLVSLTGPATLWTGSIDNKWNAGPAANWSGGGVAAGYNEGDNVVFCDTGAPTEQVDITTTVNPGSVLVNNSATTFVLGGTGSIAGACGLTKNGSGALTLATHNAYTGETRINAGTVIVAAEGALGASAVRLGDTTGSSDAGLLVAGAFTVDCNITVQDDGSPLSVRALGGTNTSGMAVFGGGITLDHDVRMTAVAGGTIRLVGLLDNADGNTIMKIGDGTLSISGPQTHGPGATLAVAGGTVDLNSDAGAAGLFNLSVNVSGTGHARFGASQHLAALNLASGASQVTAGGAKVLATKGLSIDPAAARLDLTDNDMIVDYTGGTPYLPSPELENIKQGIASGWASMMWTGNGIISSAAAIDPISLGLGYAQNDLLFAPYDVFSGEPVDSSTILVKFTYNGDVNLDGCVDDNDVTFFNLFYDGGAVDTHYWHEGDIFGYDGRVDDNDVTILNLTYGLGIGDPLGGAAPEPATLVLVALGGALALLRRRSASS